MIVSVQLLFRLRFKIYCVTQSLKFVESHLFRYSSANDHTITYLLVKQRSIPNFDVLLSVHLSIFSLVINQLDAQNFCFTISLFHASTCFEHHVLIIRRSKFYYTASGIITPISGRPVHRTTTYRCDDTRGCIIQFWPPDVKQMVLETCRGMK